MCYAFVHHKARFFILQDLKQYDAEVLKNAQAAASTQEQTNA
jgi:hypothetical protein